MDISNLFEAVPSNLPPDLPKELFSTLLKTAEFRLDRIISTGQTTPEGEWLDQDDNEWVLVLRGNAVISFAGDDASVALGPGDYLNIPAHSRHRVEMTDPNQPTIWLALHYH
jgi:cupin 2 domain-containing protein